VGLQIGVIEMLNSKAVYYFIKSVTLKAFGFTNTRGFTLNGTIGTTEVPADGKFYFHLRYLDNESGNADKAFIKALNRTQRTIKKYFDLNMSHADIVAYMTLSVDISLPAGFTGVDYGLLFGEQLPGQSIQYVNSQDFTVESFAKERFISDELGRPVCSLAQMLITSFNKQAIVPRNLMVNDLIFEDLTGPIYKIRQKVKHGHVRYYVSADKARELHPDVDWSNLYCYVDSIKIPGKLVQKVGDSSLINDKQITLVCVAG